MVHRRHQLQHIVLLLHLKQQHISGISGFMLQNQTTTVQQHQHQFQMQQQQQQKQLVPCASKQPQHGQDLFQLRICSICMQQQHQVLLHLQQLGGHLLDLQQQQQQQHHHHRLRTRTVMPRSVHLRPVRHPTCYEGFGTPNFYFHDSIANKCAYDNLLMRLAGRILVGRRPHSRSSSVELRTGRWGPAGSLQVPQRVLRSSLSCYCCYCCCGG